MNPGVVVAIVDFFIMVLIAILAAVVAAVVGSATFDSGDSLLQPVLSANIAAAHSIAVILNDLIVCSFLYMMREKS